MDRRTQFPMKKYVINLTHRVDRKEAFERNNPTIGDINWLSAADGNDIKYDDIKELGFDTPDYWRDPFKNRRLTKGEVGCFISHFILWRMCAQMNQPIMVMEDDCILGPEWDKFVTDYNNGEMAGQNLFFVGYSEVETARLIDDTYCRPDYPYNTHCYVIWPEGARILMQNALNASTGKYEIVPSDQHIVNSINDLNCYAYTVPRAWQTAREEDPSNVEPTADDDYFVDRKLRPYTVGTDRHKMRMLNDSAAKYGVYPKNLGNNVDWLGGNMDFPGGMHKLHLLYDALQNINPRDVVLFTDAYDVFYADDEATIMERYLGMGSRVVFSAEEACWPDAELSDSYPEASTKYRYLNSGTFIGEAGELLKILEQALVEPPEADDQRFMTKMFLSGEYDISLDNDQYIFTVAEKNCDFYGEHMQLRNKEINTTSCIFHGAGGSHMRPTLEGLYQQIAPPTSFSYIPGMNKNLVVLDKDMLVVDFMTQSQCEELIELSEKHGDWGSLSYDKFPAQEIRVKELGLWEEVEKRWEEYINPIVERYWHPLAMYGLRDAFTMRYSVDTQKSLNLHHDASLVTGSVKLNEDYIGADLVFPRQGITNADVPVGACILFPGQVTHGHECTELIDGIKYSLTMWTSRYTGDVI